MSGARQFAAATLAAMHPHLTPASACKGGALIAAAGNLRTELRLAFPGVKFSVRTERFAGGNALRVAWVDGPTSAQVDALANRYSAGDFDGMTDCFEYRRNAWRDAFGAAKYVSTTRSDSPRAVASAIRTVRARFADAPDALTPESFNAGTFRGEWPHLVRVTLSRRTWCLTRPLPQPVATVETTV